MMLSLISNSNIVNVVVSGDTTIIDNVRLRRRSACRRIFMMRIFRLRQSIRRSIARRSLLPCGEGSRRCSATFDENLTSEDNSLQLNIGPMTNIVTLNGAALHLQSGEFRASYILYKYNVQHSGNDNTSENCSNVSILERLK